MSSETSPSPRQWLRSTSIAVCIARREGLFSWKRLPVSSTMSARCSMAIRKISSKVFFASSLRIGSRSFSPRCVSEAKRMRITLSARFAEAVAVAAEPAGGCSVFAGALEEDGMTRGGLLLSSLTQTRPSAWRLSASARSAK